MSDAPLPSSFDGDTDFYDENRWQKFKRRLTEEPLIPVGVGLTCWALFSAARSIRKGDGAKTNQLFRYRLYAQAFTIVAMIGGSFYYNADRLKRKEFTNLIAKKKAQEKKEAWIRELEARDAEDKEWREKMGKVRDMKREEAEREALEEKRRREGRSDDGKGLIETVKGKLKDAKETELAREAAEQRPDLAALARQRRAEMEKKQEIVKREQQMVKESAGMGPDTRIWGESGGLFGWRRIANLWSKPRDDDSSNDRPEGK
ncbi:hypothetical protein P7C71_g1231, partial [Lecanoromycetidae sp. Uapishka_2]